MKSIFVLLVFICPFLVATESPACGLCTMVVGFWEKKDSTLLGTRDAWLNELLATSNEICFSKVQLFATPAQCKSFIELNTPYIVDLIIAEAKSDSICASIGACSSAEDSIDYKLILPIINEQQVTYLVEEKEITQETYFHYKLFLGNPSFLSNESYQLAVELNHIKDCDVNLKVTNKTTFVQSESCDPKKNCSMSISFPGRGVWYYITVHAKLSGSKASFSLNATEKNETIGHWIFVSHSRFNGQRFAFILCLSFSILCLLCLCISRCVIAKRRYKRQQSYIPMMMQQVPETMIPMATVQNFGMFPSEPFDPDSSPVVIIFPPPVMNGQV